MKHMLLNRDRSSSTHILNQQLTLSKNLVLKKCIGKSDILINRLSSTAVNASPSLIKFLKHFSEKPVSASRLLKEYNSRDLLQSVTHMQKLNFLIPECINEELEWLEKRVEINNIRKFETEHFIVFHPGSNGYQAINFSDFMERVFNFLSSKLKFFSSHKVVIYICSNRKEFQNFWGDSTSPDWADAFVFSSSLIVVSRQRVNQTSLKGEGPFQGMPHELAHVFLGQLKCTLPTWLEEGLCEYLSQSQNGEVSLEKCHHKKIYGFKELELFADPSLLELDSSPVGKNICYQQSHSFVAQLMNLKGRQRFIDCIISMDISDFFRSRFKTDYGVSIERIQSKWQKTVSQKHLLKLKISKNLRIIQGSKNVLLYNSFFGGSLKASKKILTLLDCFRNRVTLDEITQKFDIKEFDSIIISLFEKKLIVFDNNLENNRIYRKFDRESIKDGLLINKIRLNISNACNMACRYCYIDPENSGHMSWQTAKKALTLFFDLQKKYRKKESQIRFFGGEPLLNWDVMEKVFGYVNEIRDDIKVEYILNTNGTIITEQIAGVLASNNVNLSISLDGLSEIHDTFRPFKSGEGSFSKIDKNVDLLINFDCKIALSATIGDHNYNRLDNLIAYVAHKNSRFNCAISLYLQNMCMESKQGLDTVPAVKKVTAVRNSILYALKKRVDVGFGMIMFPFNALVDLKPGGVYCNTAAGEEICIDPEGDIYPCGTLKIKLGNIETFNNIFQTAEYLDLIKRVTGSVSQCRGCDIEAFCAGGCVADAYQDKNIFLPAKNCKCERHFFKSMVKAYLNGTYLY